MTITATFDQAVTGVTASDFGLTSSAVGLTYTTSVATTDNTVWVMTITATGGYADSVMGVSMSENSGSIAAKNAAASNNGFYLAYVAQRCVVCTGVNGS